MIGPTCSHKFISDLHGNRDSFQVVFKSFNNGRSIITTVTDVSVILQVVGGFV